MNYTSLTVWIKEFISKIKHHTKRKKVDKEDILWIIKHNGELGVSELVFGDLLVRFSPNTDSLKDTLTTESQTPSIDTTPKHTQTNADDELALATLGIDNPTEFMERLEIGEMEFAESNDSSIREEI